MKNTVIILLLVLAGIMGAAFMAFVVLNVFAARQQHERQMAEGKEELSRLGALSADDDVLSL